MALGATSTIVGAAAQAHPFNPLVTAAIAVALCGTLFALRLVRRRVDERRIGEHGSAVHGSAVHGSAVGFDGAADHHLSGARATNPTEPPARR